LCYGTTDEGRNKNVVKNLHKNNHLQKMLKVVNEWKYKNIQQLINIFIKKYRKDYYDMGKKIGLN